MPSHDLSALVDELEPTRRAHSRQVAALTRSSAGRYVPDEQLEQLHTAALLHDIGYHPDLAASGFHPLDGAAALQAAGYPPLVCHLVATHTAATLEAAERDIPASAFEPYLLHQNTLPARGVLIWADLHTSHTGAPCTTTARLAGILHRYGPEHPVHRYVSRHRAALLAAGTAPTGLGHPDAAAIAHLPPAR